MRKIFLLAATFALAVTAAVAVETPETFFGRAAAAFSGLSAFKPAKPPAGTAGTVLSGIPPRIAPPQPVELIGSNKIKGTRTLRLRGFVTVNGSGYVPQHSSWANITVYGYTSLQDQDGHYLRGDIRVEDSRSYYISGNYISDWARPYAYVDIYDNGRLLGTTRVEGSIMVSGFKNGDWLNLSGSGYVDGFLTYQEPDPPKP